jgi:hypothetical protein
MTLPDGHGPQQYEAAVNSVRLDLFTATPSTLGPFNTSLLSWQVTIPHNADDIAVSIQLNHANVGPAGELTVEPLTTQTYVLMARAGQYFKLLSELTIQVDLATCTIGGPLAVSPQVATEIQTTIEARTDGVYLKNLGSPNPVVTITPGQMAVHLVLSKRVSDWPDPTITIDMSFGLEIVPGPLPTTGRFHAPELGLAISIVPPVIGAVDLQTAVDASFPWWAWLVPGAMLGLPIVTSGIEADTERELPSMADQIANGLNTLFQDPAHKIKQNVTLSVAYGSGQVGVTFCPIPEPTLKP